MALSDKQVADVCLSGKGTQQCRYLHTDYDRKNWTPVCTCKKKTADKKVIDLKVRGQKPAGSGGSYTGWQPAGDNCQGYIHLTSAPQGYDVPGSV